MEKVVIVLEKEPVYIDGVLHFKRTLKKDDAVIHEDIVTQKTIDKIATKINMFDKWVDLWSKELKKDVK